MESAGALTTARRVVFLTTGKCGQSADGGSQREGVAVGPVSGSRLPISGGHRSRTQFTAKPSR